jgi:chemotaxis protein methyltransferase CheR
MSISADGSNRARVEIRDPDGVAFLQWALPQLGMRWPGFRRVRRQVYTRIRRRLEELRLPNLDAYRDYLQHRQEEWTCLDGFCRISISRLYRDRDVFDHLRDIVLPRLANEISATSQCTLRICSAGCASGEEPYTLAIIARLGSLSRFEHLQVRIVAVDTDDHLLDRARRGRYGDSSLKDLPKSWLPIAFQPIGPGHCLKEEFRRNVRFVRLDIRREFPPGPFHLVLCRNLAFTYFDESQQRGVLNRIARQLLPGGVLVTGKKERLPAGSAGFSVLEERLGVYQKERQLE